MAISAGTKLGPYEVKDLLGAGGMGDVYRARDQRLGREVAIKFVPREFATDQTRLSRFEQEARVLGTLNHANLLAVYDVGTEDGSPYIVSELLEGVTLRQRLQSGALPIRKAIDYALQMARGLAAAHDKSIVHRDLKPENIFITKDGRVKVLDFGLAKLVQLNPEDATRTVHSDAGTVLGTVGYMSPEQVRGKPLDARSDLFSFGVVLYEMLSGKRAFQRDSAVETMSAILKEEPPALVTTDQNSPTGLQRIVEHCLEKNPEERFQSARDIAFDLETLTTASTTSAARQAVTSARQGRIKTLALAFAALVALLAAGILLGRRTVSAPSVPEYQQLTFRRGTVTSARFAGNGQVIYSAAWDGNPPELFTAGLDGRGAISTGIHNAEVQAVSRDGSVLLISDRQFVFQNVQPGTLSRMPLSGGAPRPLLQDVQSADWGPDGNIAVARYVGQHFRLEYPIGKVLYETQQWISDPRVSPKGDKVAFVEHPLYGDDMGAVAIVDSAGHKRTLSQRFASLQTMVWSPRGNELWFSAAQTGVTTDVYGVDLNGKMRVIARAPGGFRVFDVAPDGRMIAAQGHRRFSTIGSDGKSKEERDLTIADWSIPIAISSDDSTVLIDEEAGNPSGRYAAYLRKLDGSPPVDLGEGEAMDLSFDGKWVVAGTQQTPNQLIILPTGAGEPRTVTHDNIDYRQAAWLPDNKHVVFLGLEPGHAERIYMQDVNGGSPQPIAPEGVSGHVACSPDGTKISVSGDHTWIVPLDGGEPHIVPGMIRGQSALTWSADSKWLYVIHGLGDPGTLYKVDPVTGKSELIRHFAPTDRAGVTNIGPIRVSRDMKTYAYGNVRDLNELYLATGIK